MIEDLIAHITPPIKLTRKTLTNIVIRTKNRQAALDNPQEFALYAARIVREGDRAVGTRNPVLQRWDLVRHERVDRRRGDGIGTSHPCDEFHLRQYRCSIRHGEEVVEKVKKMKAVRFFVKLPGWFKVRLPSGAITRTRHW